MLCGCPLHELPQVQHAPIRVRRDSVDEIVSFRIVGTVDRISSNQNRLCHVTKNSQMVFSSLGRLIGLGHFRAPRVSWVL